ncbi:MAG: 1-acyl-sn-glycerol-3-phosphate acyltransferase [Betaproteobacteria bacterium]|nr:1-acyl-sn-glycerol-3-phosphate acyltransferase [Betaproteobacteria bacterium]
MSATPIGYRLSRLLRLSVHMLAGAVKLARHSARWSEQRRVHEIGVWSRRLLRIVGVHVEHTGTLPAAGLVVTNHISWMDIFVLNAVAPARFVSKSEVAHWPLIGYLCTKSGTLYIERGRKRAARLANAAIAAALETGERVVLFPEGTTSFGRHVLHFHAALLQPAIDVGAQVHPASLRYTDARGAHTVAPSYVGEQSLIGSLWTLLGERRIVAHLSFAPPVAAQGAHRRELADALHAAVSRSLAATD